MYPYRAYTPVQDQRFIGFGLGFPFLAIGGLSFLGGLLGGAIGSRPPFYGYPPYGFGYPPMGYPPMGFPGYY
jgi:hypothetical protein